MTNHFSVKLKLRRFIFSFLIVFPNLIIAQQHPVKQEEDIKNVSRIDSLTVAYYKTNSASTKAKLNLIETPLTEALFYEKMNSLGSKFEFAFNEEIARQIGYMTNPASSFMPKCMRSMDVYFPIFDEVLDKMKLPEEIKYLSVIESALNPNAVSWCGATGLWQFMPATGKIMHLEINAQIDERKDIVKSTEKALHYLSKNYASYNDWFLALAAYNCGPGNVNKAIRKSGGKRTFWEIKKFLPRETQQYIPKFIATVFVMNFVDLNSIFNCDRNSLNIVQIELDKPLNLQLTSALMQWDDQVIQEYNAFYKTAFIPELYGEKKLYLPYQAAMQFLEMKDSVYHIQENTIFSYQFSAKQTSVVYKVKKGDNMYRIATKYNVSAEDIMRWNNLKTKTVYVGQQIKVYYSVPTKEEMVLDTTNSSERKYYVVINEQESFKEICDKISQIDRQKTLLANELLNENESLPRGTLLYIYPISTI
jgi:membrane-bound lytic murein transglycosylase D